MSSEDTILEADLQKAQQLLDEGYDVLDGTGGLEAASAIEECSRALELFKEARKLVGDDADLKVATRLGIAAALSQRGHQYRYARDHALALADLSQALRLNPDNALDYYYRALSYLAKGETRQAKTDFTAYLQRGDNEYLREVVRNRLAELVPGQEDAKASMTHWRNLGVRYNAEASNLLHPREAEAAPQWAAAAKTYNKAIEAFNRALEFSPKDAQTRFGLLAALSEQAASYREMEEYDLALENYNRAQQVWPQPRQIFYRAETLYQAGHTTLARAAFEEYVAQADDPALRAEAQRYLALKDPRAGR